MLRFTVSHDIDNDKKKEVVDKLRNTLMKCMFKMQELAVDYAPVDSSDLWKNISLFPEILASKYVLTSKMPYSEAIEYGTRPFYAPIEPLKEWAGRKLGDENAGYAVRNKIAKVGIKAQPFMRPAYYEVLWFWFGYFKEQEFSN